MIFGPTAMALLEARDGILVRWLLWMTVKNRFTGVPVNFGLWNGEDDETFTVGGSPRVYRGAQSAFSVSPVRYSIGLSVQTQSVSLSGLTQEAIDLYRNHKLDLAPVELHVGIFSPVSHQPVEFARAFKGFVNRAPMPREGVNGRVVVDLELVSTARNLTRTLGTMKSEATQSLRSGDKFRKYGSVTAIATPWGQS